MGLAEDAPRSDVESHQSADSDRESDHHVQNEAEDSTQSQDLEALSRVSSGPPYSAFSPGMKAWIVAMNSVSAFISPMTANIYFPVIPTLAKELHVTDGQVLLTVTTYMIFQAISPMFFGDFGDATGRRPAFIIAFTIYLGANIGLALQRSYIALLLLRMLQSAGSSGTLSLVYGVVADIAPSSERGKYMGIVGAGITVGPALGPVIGGLLSQYLGWPSIFWFLAIVTVVWMIPYILAVPETGRKVVGNGSVRPPVLNTTVVDYLRFRHQPPDPTTIRRKAQWPNPINTLKVLGHKDMAMVLGFNATVFIGFQIVTATLSSQFKEIYGYNDVQLGLCYLPIGGATMIASVGNGFLADWNFRRIAKQMGVNVDRKRGNDLKDFPIEKVRIQLIVPLIAVGSVFYISYGWILHLRLSVAVPLVWTFFIGLCVTGSFQINNLLIVDLYAEAPATATAANNLCRCLTGALFTAVISRIISSIGVGWAFTLIGLIFTCASPSLWIIVKYGPKWRGQRLQKARELAEEQKAKAKEKTSVASEGNGDGVVASPPIKAG